MCNKSQNQGRKERKKNKYEYCFSCGIKILVSDNTRPGLLKAVKPEDK